MTTLMSSSMKRLQFSDAEFDFISSLMTEKTGIVVKKTKREMVYNRIMQRVRALELATIEDYCNLLRCGNKDEMNHFINVITTNFTNFFREEHHFDFLLNSGFDEILKANNQKHLKMWSAACSTGQEPYTLAMTLDQYLAQNPDINGHILATDIDTNVLNAARNGVYELEKLGDLESQILSNYFLKGSGNQHGLVKVKPALQEYISFQQLNFMESWPHTLGPFDLIICRNAMIYFEPKTQKQLIEKFMERLVPGGFLIIGHSETLCGLDHLFEQHDKTTYRKVG